MIDEVLGNWLASSVRRVVVVVRRDDQPLQAACAAWDVDVVVPEIDPPQMRDSVQLGVEFVAQRYHPRPHDCWLLAPADMPTLSGAVADARDWFEKASQSDAASDRVSQLERRLFPEADSGEPSAPELRID